MQDDLTEAPAEGCSAKEGTPDFFGFPRLRGRAFVPFPEMAGMLESELSARFGIDPSGAERFGDILYFPDYPDGLPNPYFSRVAMMEPRRIPFASIGSAAKILRSAQRNWAPHQFRLFRRAALVQERLPHVNLRPRAFPLSVPNTPMGLYTLLSEGEMLASARTDSPFPAGAVDLVEDHENPPSRAYLKLEEALAVAGTILGSPLPAEGDRCFEAGACPGGWTWVLRRLGAEVLAVDRAELAPSLMSDPLVRFVAHDAFTLAPADVCSMMGTDRLDWLLSDVICYPGRLLDWIHRWIESGLARRIVCTIKMQGEIDWGLVARFAEIDGAHVRHLNHNKHELTFIRV